MTVLRFEEPMQRFRFLLTGGRVVDVDATRDDSVLREWVLEQVAGHKVKPGDGIRIEGVTRLAEQGELL